MNLKSPYRSVLNGFNIKSIDFPSVREVVMHREYLLKIVVSVGGVVLAGCVKSTYIVQKR